MQYAGLGLFVVAEAIVFMPMIYMAMKFTHATGNNVLLSAGLMTLMLAGGITFTAFSSKKNFSFLAPFITVGSFVALG
ncbi:MAG TPA: permease, partial [Thiolinea sp.]|nr:permease [Thiolinea sp.]